MTRWRGRVATLVVVAATALGFAVAVPYLQFSTKITEFLPDSADRGAQIAALLADSELARVMILDLSLDSSLPGPRPAPDRLVGLTRSLIAFLRTQPDVAVARSGFTEADVAAVTAFLQAWPATTFLPRTAYSDDALRARLSELRDQLAGPAGLVVRQTAPRDPLGGMWEPVRTLQAARTGSLPPEQREGAGGGAPDGSAGGAGVLPRVIDDDGILLTGDRSHAFVFVETRSSPFDSDAQRAFRAELDG